MRVLLIIFLIRLGISCIHDTFTKTISPIFYDDVTHHHGRRLQTTPSNIGSLRIYTDYTAITSSDAPIVNMIKRMTNISTLVFYNMLSVERLDTLYYPSNVSPNCSTITIPKVYIDQGVNRTDLGIMVGDDAVDKDNLNYIAKATPCVYLSSSSRPIWGIIIWNTKNLKTDQEGFQQNIYVSLHEITHILGFSAIAYKLFPNGNPLITVDGKSYLNNSKINDQIFAHFGCRNSNGLPLQNQDGTDPSSHWQRKVLFNDYMTASNTKNTIISRFSLALLDSIGWYPNVNYDYAQKNLWGKGQGCSFLDTTNCTSTGKEFCDKGFGCDFDSTGIGSCRVDIFSDQCQYYKYYTNTICIDPTYEKKNLNQKMNALEAGGWNSRCFASDFRQRGLIPTSLNYRCYQMTCSDDRKVLYIRIGGSVLVCRTPGQVIKAPITLTGTLTCPSTFDNYCQVKQTCPNHCNINGICINGQCLCTGSTKFTDGCLNTELTVQQVGNTGGLFRALLIGGQSASLNGSTSTPSCFEGYYLDEFGQCVQK